MKKQLKNYFKFTFLTISILLLSLSCQEEDNIISEASAEIQDSPFSMLMIAKNEIDENTIISERLQPFSKFPSNVLARDVYSSEYDFTVDTDYAKYIESNDGTTHSYTFLYIFN